MKVGMEFQESLEKSLLKQVYITVEVRFFNKKYKV